MNSQSVSLFEAAAEISESLNSLYKGTFVNKQHLLDYMEANNWFGLAVQTAASEPIINKNDLEQFKDLLTLWLSAYRKPGCVKIDLMLDHFKGV